VIRKLERNKCHDCDAMEGEFHEFGCDMERCPFCGRQLISCGCRTKHFYPESIDLRDWICMDKNTRPPFSGLPESVYRSGLTQSQDDEYDKLLEKKGRIPWIQYPNLCCYCGALWPKMFRVTDREWEKYVEPFMRSEMLCIGCWEWIKAAVDDANSARAQKRKVK
jgi:hypothetical protein